MLTDRLCSEQNFKPSALAGTATGDKALLNEPHCIQVTRDNLARLQSMVKQSAQKISTHAFARLPSHLLLVASASPAWQDHVLLLASLRILRANLHRLLISGVAPQSLGVQVP